MTANPVYSDGMTSPTDEPASERRRETAHMAEVNRVALLLMAAWEAAEGTAVSTSYVATFADMARAVVADREASEQA